MHESYFFLLLLAFILMMGLVWFLVREIRRLKSYSFSGIVQVGRGNGEELGAKTANFDVLLAKGIPEGLYLCEVFIEKKSEMGVLYYGYNSVIKNNSLEVHIFDFSGDLYGKHLTVKTKKFMRRPKKFKTNEALAVNIKKDLEVARKLFSKEV